MKAPTRVSNKQIKGLCTAVFFAVAFIVIPALHIVDESLCHVNHDRSSNDGNLPPEQHNTENCEICKLAGTVITPPSLTISTVQNACPRNTIAVQPQTPITCVVYVLPFSRAPPS